MRQSGKLHLVHYDYLRPTSPAFPRADFLVETLRSRKWDVQVWADGRPDRQVKTGLFGETVHSVTDPYHAILNLLSRLQHPPPPTIPIDSAPPDAERAGLRPHRARGPLRRSVSRLWSRLMFPDLELFWSKRVARRLAKRVGPGDVVLTCSRPESAGRAGERAAALGAFWWFDFADGWCCEGLKHRARQPSRYQWQRELDLELKWVTAADGVSTVNEVLAAYFSRLRNGLPVHVYPNVIPRDLAGAAVAPKTRTASGSISLLYFGRLRASDAGRNLNPLIALLGTRRPDDMDANFIFYGDLDSQDLEEIERLKRLGFGVKTHAPVDRKHLPAIVETEQVDAMLVVNSPDSTGSTSKLFDGLAIGLPILLFSRADSEAASMVEHSGAGCVIAFGEEQPPYQKVMSQLLRSRKAGNVRPDKWQGSYQARRLADRLEGLREKYGVD